MTGETAKEGVFIDASVWIAASGSPSGGSSLVLEICGGRRFYALCSQRVLQEAQTNIRAKLPVEALVRFYRLLAAAEPGIISPVAPDEEVQYSGIIAEKDAHVVATAVRGGAAYLVTLDRKHLANAAVRGAGLPIQILLPGEFISLVLH
jgi:predicted nucleic acid-binding protein